MAKRKRLGPALATSMADPAESGPNTDPKQPVRASMPIAQMAGASAQEAALSDLAAEVHAARDSGRLAQFVPLNQIDLDHLLRDRLIVDAAELAALKTSIAARGQQVPIEVVQLKKGAQGKPYGLISGLRRVTALQELLHETGDAKRFGSVLTITRQADSAPQSYIAMVEENELRVGLSYYERAAMAKRAAEAGVFESSHAAIAALFASASKAKRSKISSFARIYALLGDVLQFPCDISERFGLRLAKALSEGHTPALREALEGKTFDTAAAEQALLGKTLSSFGSLKGPKPPHRVAFSSVGDHLQVDRAPGIVRLSGADVTDALVADLVKWLQARRSQ